MPTRKVKGEAWGVLLAPNPFPGSNLLVEPDELRTMDVVLPARAAVVRLRVAARPEKTLAELLVHPDLELPKTAP